MKDNILDMENWKKENIMDLDAIKGEYMKPQMSQGQVERLRAVMNQAKADNKKARIRSALVKFGATAAAVMAAFVILPNTSANVAYAMEQIPLLGQLVQVVTFRDYTYEDERHRADINIPELTVGQVTGNEEQQAEGAQDGELQEKLQKTTEEINVEIRSIADELISYFEEYVNDEMGYQDIIVKSEVLATTQEYFTLKILCYQGAGSGYQWNYYYTIDLNTGERLRLEDIFVEGADYITPISENIKEQMLAQMEADEMVSYWLESEIEDLNFKSISEDTSFYLNEAGNVVIGFDEGDVAPMYMGAVEFEIPGEVLAEIRK